MVLRIVVRRVLRSGERVGVKVGRAIAGGGVSGMMALGISEVGTETCLVGKKRWRNVLGTAIGRGCESSGDRGWRVGAADEPYRRMCFVC